MYEVAKGLFIGSDRDCFYDERIKWAVIHACKTPCHERALNYRGSLLPNHPHHLTYEKGNHLYLNIIDPHQPLFKLPLFINSLNFIDKHKKERNILIHCNLGISRSPSIALLWLAKRTDFVSDESYNAAYIDFKQIYPYYQPGRGIYYYFLENWKYFTNPDL